MSVFEKEQEEAEAYEFLPLCNIFILHKYLMRKIMSKEKNE